MSRLISKKTESGMTFSKERSRWEIIQDLLKVTQEESKAKKTRIMQRAYLDWRNFQRYFDFLLEEGFISRCNPDSYELTEKGEELIRRIEQVDEMLNRKV